MRYIQIEVYFCDSSSIGKPLKDEQDQIFKCICNACNKFHKSNLPGKSIEV